MLSHRGVELAQVMARSPGKPGIHRMPVGSSLACPLVDLLWIGFTANLRFLDTQTTEPQSRTVDARITLVKPDALKSGTGHHLRVTSPDPVNKLATVVIVVTLTRKFAPTLKRQPVPSALTPLDSNVLTLKPKSPPAEDVSH